MKKEELVEKIILRSFGEVIEWTAPEWACPIGPHFPEIFLEFESRKREALAKLRQNLIDQSAAKLEDYFTKRTVFFSGAQNESEVRRIIRTASFPSIPLWFSAGFGTVENQADFQYWANINSYSESEALCLTLGFEPLTFDRNLFVQAAKSGKRNKVIVNFLHERALRLRRKFNPFGLEDYRIEAGELLDWIVETDTQVSSDFLTYLINREEKKNIVKSLDPREKTSLLQIIFVMAMDCYKFDPDTKRIPMAKEIEQRAASNGITLSRETIRKHLESCKEFYNGEWKSD